MEYFVAFMCLRELWKEGREDVDGWEGESEQI